MTGANDDRESCVPPLQAMTLHTATLVEPFDEQNPECKSANDGFWSPIRRSWMLFADETTTHGVAQVGRENKHMATRLLFGSVVIVCAALCIWMMTTQINQYLTYGVKTSIELTAIDNLTFPAITFCSENTYRKSVVGGSLSFLRDMAAFCASDMEELNVYLDTQVPTCHNSTINNSLTAELNLGFTFWRQRTMAGVMALTTMDSVHSVVECVWLGAPINCSDNLFLNHLTDYGWCFTFNPSANTISSVNSGTAYGRPYGPGDSLLSTGEPWSISNSGPRNGLALVLNARSADYCVNRAKGVGFRAIVHDPDVQPLFFLENVILLSPGFDISVAIQVTNITRETESLGRCKSFIPISWYPNATVYFKQACYMGCFTDYIIAQCGCFPTYGPINGFNMFYEPAHKNVGFCYGVNASLCMNNGIKTFIQGGTTLTSACSQCADPCNELRYTSTLSFEYFPYLVAARSDFVSVNFFIASLQVTTITETQAVSMTDLVSALGGLLGLFLGMSIVSIVEIVRQLVVCTKAIGQGISNVKRSQMN